MVAALATREQMSFAELKSALRATDGNVSAHARKLEDAGYIVATKRFEGRVPRTEYALTGAGRKALKRVPVPDGAADRFHAGRREGFFLAIDFAIQSSWR